MRVELDGCILRSFVAEDAESLARYANNRKIWRNLRDLFPHPYALEDAQAFIRTVTAADPETCFAVEVDGDAVGAIGFGLHKDVERVSAEIGYWLGEPFWGRGIMTAVVRAATDYAMAAYQLTRVYAVPFVWNTASFRVLEKAGYSLEGRMRRSAIKDGRVVDQLLYAYVRSGDAAR